MSLPAVFAIEGVPRDYDWGSTSAIEDMLGIPRDGKPLAELWFGAHPDDPARVPMLGTTLDAVIATDPIAYLGEPTASRFGGRLPFLLKVLAAERPLSIQVHPTLEQARAGFAAEDESGIPREAPNRSYRDANHKPELICALTDFEALCGFRRVDDIRAVLQRFALPELAGLEAVLGDGTAGQPLRAPFEYLLTLPQPQSLTAAVTVRARELTAADPGFGAARAVLLAADHFPADIGVVLSLLLNYVVLRPGQAIYLAAGNVHAYLHGVGIEIMATSDNVLRCGLTSKHIDVPELLKITNFTPLADPRWPAEGEWFQVPVPDFELVRIDLGSARKPGRQTYSCATGNAWQPYIVLCASGTATVTVGPDHVELTAGRAAFVPARESAFTITGNGLVFTATVGSVP